MTKDFEEVKPADELFPLLHVGVVSLLWDLFASLKKEWLSKSNSTGLDGGSKKLRSKPQTEEVISLNP